MSNCHHAGSVIRPCAFCQLEDERDEYKRQAALYHADMMKVREQRDAAIETHRRDHNDLVEHYTREKARADDAERKRDVLREALYKLVQVAASRPVWKQHTWQFIEECDALAKSGGVPKAGFERMSAIKLDPRYFEAVRWPTEEPSLRVGPCTACKGSGIVAGKNEYETEPCQECGTP